MATTSGFVPVGPTSGGKVYAFNNIGITPGVVAPANPQRTQISFHNPGTVIMFIAPVACQAINPTWDSQTNLSSGKTSISNAPLSPNNTALGGCFAIGAGGWITLYGECASAYQAFAGAGTNNPLTVSDTNV